MRALDHGGGGALNDPLDVIERIVLDRDWLFDRNSDQELAVRAPGQWCDYNLFFSWNEDACAMHFSCAFDMRVPGEKIGLVHELLALINETMWMGHFCLWADEGQPIFRHVLPLRGQRGPSQGQIEDMVETAVAECERFFPAFQFVVWGGKTPAEALRASMIETLGEA